MPGGNGTGPTGAGPMTGRAAGYCVGFSSPGFANSARCGFGRGMGMRRSAGGRGFGFRNRFYASNPVREPEISAEQEREYLASELKVLETELEAVKKRLDELDK